MPSGNLYKQDQDEVGEWCISQLNLVQTNHSFAHEKKEEFNLDINMLSLRMS